MFWLNVDGLNYLWKKIVLRLNTKVDKIDGKDLSTNDYTDAEKEKLNKLSSYVGNTSVQEQINTALNEFDINGGDADTLDGKHASDFALMSNLNTVKNLVGDTSVQQQISEALNELDINGGNADTLDGLHADHFASATDLNTVKNLVGTKSVQYQINTALSNFSSGKTLSEHMNEEMMILTSLQYGDKLPGESGEPYTHVSGRIFFRKSE